MFARNNSNKNNIHITTKNIIFLLRKHDIKNYKNILKKLLFNKL